MARFDGKLTKEEERVYEKRIDPRRIYMAKVMDTRSPTRAGEILVYIIDSGLDEKDSRNWFIASYASGFFGTNYYDGSSNGSYEKDPQSFGSWFPIPCVGNYVFVFFPVVSGENTRCFWFSCPVNPGLDYMVPGIPSKFKDNKAHTEDDEPPALSDRNTLSIDAKENKMLNDDVIKSQGKQTEYEPLNLALKRQGLSKDKIRGYSSASAKREAPSMCYGIKTPLGNTFVMDDGWIDDDNRTAWTFNILDKDKLADGDIDKKRQLVGSDSKTPFQRKFGDDLDKRNNAGFRFRTRNGTQILIADEGTIYMINNDGSCWVEITKNGYLEAYSKTGVSVASDGDINLHTKKNVFIEADETLAIKAEKINIETKGDINVFNTPHIITKAEIRGTNIQCEKGNITTLESSGAKLKGQFQGTLKGTAETAMAIIQVSTKLNDLEIAKLDPQYVDNEDVTKCVPCGQKRNEVHACASKHSEDELLKETINTKVPTHEPYCGHCKKLDEENDTKNDDEENENENNENSKSQDTSKDSLNISSNNNCKGTNTSCGGSSCRGGSCNSSSPVTSCVGCSGVTNQINKTPTPNTIEQKAISDNVPLIDLSKNFTLPQLCYSETASSNKISNVPSSEQTTNLKYVAENVLEPIKEHFGQVNINSGFRGQLLNSMVGGSLTSQHLSGQAVDIEVPGVSNWELANWIKDNIDYDQLILENCTNLKNDPNSGWVHVSFNKNGNRYQQLTIKNGSTRSGLWM